MNTAYMNTSVHLCRCVVSIILDECIGVKLPSDIVTLCLASYETVKEINILQSHQESMRVVIILHLFHFGGL